MDGQLCIDGANARCNEPVSDSTDAGVAERDLGSPLTLRSSRGLSTLSRSCRAGLLVGGTGAGVLLADAVVADGAGALALAADFSLALLD